MSINKHIDLQITIPRCLDQPFLNKVSLEYNMSNNQVLKQYCINCPIDRTYNLFVENANEHYKTIKNYTIIHFPTDPGHYISKIIKIQYYFSLIIVK